MRAASEHGKKSVREAQLNYLVLSKEIMETHLAVLDKKMQRHGEDDWLRSYKPAYSPFRLYADSAKSTERYDSHKFSVAAIGHLAFCGLAVTAWNSC